MSIKKITIFALLLIMGGQMHASSRSKKNCAVSNAVVMESITKGFVDVLTQIDAEDTEINDLSKKDLALRLFDTLVLGTDPEDCSIFDLATSDVKQFSAKDKQTFKLALLGVTNYLR